MQYRRDYERSTKALTSWIRKHHIRPIASHILGQSRRTLSGRKAILFAVQSTLASYRSRNRKVGGPAAVHPFRVARRVRLWGVTSTTTLVAAVGHDLVEDCGRSYPSPGGLSEGEARRVHDLVTRLTRGETESYFAYIARVALDHDALLIKLADRLDNTFDLRLSADPGHITPGKMYEVLFRGAVMDGFAPRHRLPHPGKAPFSTSRRLYDLFKSVVLLHAARHEANLPKRVKLGARKLASAACAEAELTALHILDFHYRPELARDAMLVLTDYRDRFWRVTPLGRSPIDGLFQTFDARLSKLDGSGLDELQQDTPRMLLAALSMVVILVRFAEDETFEGIAGVEQGGLVLKAQ